VPAGLEALEGLRATRAEFGVVEAEVEVVAEGEVIERGRDVMTCWSWENRAREAGSFAPV